MEESEIATVGTKGQVVIPQQMKKELMIKPKTKMAAVYRKRNKLMMAKLEVPSIGQEPKRLFYEIDRQYKGRKKRPTE